MISTGALSLTNAGPSFSSSNCKLPRCKTDATIENTAWNQNQVCHERCVTEQKACKITCISSSLSHCCHLWLKVYPDKSGGLRLGLWCLTPLSTIFQLYCGGHFYRWRKLEYPDKIHRPVTSHWQTLSHNVVSSTPRQSGIKTYNISGDR